MRSFLKTIGRVFLGAFFLGVTAASALAQTTQPERCKMGIYVVDLHQLDVQKRSFNANFWLWSLCAREQRQPLKTMEFVNANNMSASLDQTAARNGIFWSQRKIDGSFRQEWNVTDYPFDRHVLTVTVEEGNDDARAFQYEADQAKSGYDHKIDIPGWRIDGFRLVPTEYRYDTTFGDPSLPPEGSAHYSRLRAEIMVSRDSFTGFLKMASVVYVAAALALLSFLFHLDSPSSFGSRISFLAGSLFATVINMRVSSAELGSNEGLTLIDLIHISCLILVLAATVLTIVAYRRLETGKAASVRRYDLKNLLRCSAVFIAANMTLIVSAAIRG